MAQLTLITAIYFNTCILYSSIHEHNDRCSNLLGLSETGGVVVFGGGAIGEQSRETHERLQVLRSDARRVRGAGTRTRQQVERAPVRLFRAVHEPCRSGRQQRDYWPTRFDSIRFETLWQTDSMYEWAKHRVRRARVRRSRATRCRPAAWRPPPSSRPTPAAFRAARVSTRTRLRLRLRLRQQTRTMTMATF